MCDTHYKTLKLQKSNSNILHCVFEFQGGYAAQSVWKSWETIDTQPTLPILWHTLFLVVKALQAKAYKMPLLLINHLTRAWSSCLTQRCPLCPLPQTTIGFICNISASLQSKTSPYGHCVCGWFLQNNSINWISFRLVNLWNCDEVERSLARLPFINICRPIIISEPLQMVIFLLRLVLRVITTAMVKMMAMKVTRFNNLPM